MRRPILLPILLIFFASVGRRHRHRPHPHRSFDADDACQILQGSYSWPVSTARAGYYTPRGSFAPTGLQRMHYSRKYHMSPMPHSIFFRGGYAIHGTYATGTLGRPASHGCVRLSPGHAAKLYQMVQNEGGSISITGSPPRGTRYASARRHGARAQGDARSPMRLRTGVSLPAIGRRIHSRLCLIDSAHAVRSRTGLTFRGFDFA